MTESRGLRIGDVARLVATTTRTIRYYEEIGLLSEAEDRTAGAHRLYVDADVERLREIIRLKSLLGVSLDELKELLAAEDARAAVRTELQRDDVDPARRRELLATALGLLERQLELVHRRQLELARLEADLADRRRRVLARMAELDAETDAAPAPVELGAPMTGAGRSTKQVAG